MRATITRLSALTICQILLGSLIAAESKAAGPLVPDSDNEYSLGLNFENAEAGNPLEAGDWVYSLRGGRRLFRGDLALEALLGYAEPSSDLVPQAPEDTELLVLDFSVVWFANYHHLYDRYKKEWPRSSGIKPELYIFGGPGFASLRIKDVVRDSRFSRQFSDASDDFFTVNFGAGVKLHWFEGEHHRTSRWHVRPEVRARWFTGDEDTVDWGVGLTIGYSFGRRPTCRALDLRTQLASSDVSLLIAGKPSKTERNPEQVFADLERLRAYVGQYGPRCSSLQEIDVDFVDRLIRDLCGGFPELEGCPED